MSETTTVAVKRAVALIVDDSRTVRYRVRQVLESDGDYSFQVLEAEDGKQALRQLCALSLRALPDVILLDRNMPNISGDECIRVLKTDAQWRRIPVLFLTAQSDLKEVVKGLADLEADDYLPKPFDPGELLARVKIMVRIKQAEDEALKLNLALKASLSAKEKAYEELKNTKIKLAETRAIATMTKVFEKFVPKQFLQRIAHEGIENIQAGSVESEVITILFSDIRSFTKFSENMTPHDVFGFLNAYLKRMQKPIEANLGFIDKFIGDAIMALFDGDASVQARSAVCAGVGMQAELRKYRSEREQYGQEPFLTGIGIHIGEVMIGTLGNDQRMDSTVIGDVVNLASRLEGLTKVYQANVIISNDVKDLLDPEEFLCRELDIVTVKGRQQPVCIYEVLDALSEEVIEKKRGLLEPFADALLFYRAQQWDESIQACRRCLELDQDDAVSQMFIERCHYYKKFPPIEGWNGSFEMQSK